MSLSILMCVHRKWFSIESSNSDYTNIAFVLPRGTNYYSIGVFNIYIKICYIFIFQIYYIIFSLSTILYILYI